MTTRLAVALAVSLASVGALAAQVRDAASPSPIGSGVIFGRVTSNDGGEKPLRRVTILVSGSTVRGSHTTITDEDGRYVVDGLPDDHYTVGAQKPAYVSTWAGANPGDRVPLSSVDVVNGRRVEADIVMIRGGVISGLVLDPSGHPRPSQSVQALAVRTVNGKRSVFRGVGTGAAVTDDRGEFRIFGLTPGEFVLSVGSFNGGSSAPIVTDDELRWARLQLAASAGPGAASGSTTAGPPPSARSIGYSPVYYPGTADLSQAAVVTIGAGEQRGGVDIVLTAVPLATIGGTILNADGSVPGQIQMALIPNTAAPPSVVMMGISSRVIRGGPFTFQNLQPASYTLVARYAPAGEGRAGGASASSPISYAKADVDLNGQDVTGLSLVLQPALTVSGRMTIDPAATGSLELNRVRPTLTQVSPVGVPFPMPATIAADGSFTLTGVIPNQFRLSLADEPSGWGVRSATANGADFLDTPLTIAPGQNVTGVSIVLTNHLASLSGRLADSGGKGLPYTLVLFSTDRSMWSNRSRRTQQTRAKVTGEYSFNGLAAGDYYFVALSDPLAVDLSDPDSFEALAAAASKVTIADAEKKTLNFTIKSGG